VAAVLTAGREIANTARKARRNRIQNSSRIHPLWLTSIAVGSVAPL
jgi:hypothetical protein